MTYEIHITDPFTLPASGDLSASQYRFVVPTSGQAAIAGDGVAVAGVLQNDPPAAGAAARILALGISKVVAGGVVGAGVKVSSDATGRAVAASGTKFAVGYALEAAAAAGELIPVLVLPLGHNALA